MDLIYKLRRRIYWIPLLIIAFLLLILFFFKSSKKEIWTKYNSLKITQIKQIKDNLPDEDLKTAIDYSIQYFNKIPKTTRFYFNQDVYTTDSMLESLIDFKNELNSQELTSSFFKYLKNNFKFYQSVSDNKVQFTGYYEALLSGSPTQNEQYQYPLYKRPTDLIKIDLTQFYFYKHGMPRTIRGRIVDQSIIPYYSRKEIDVDQKFIESDLCFVWLKDPIDRFFLQIQGSGIIHLTNGEILRVNYDGSNGHPYRAIGKLLLDREILSRKNISMQSIRKYLVENPDQMDEVFNYNPSYVFFRIVENGPIGSLGFPVTAFRSIATDSSIFPRGAICYIKTKIPVFNDKGKAVDLKEISGFVLNQDTGGAIKSPSRVDLFTGNGEYSELVAGYLKNHGELYFLIKK